MSYLKWYVYAAFTVHSGFKFHTGEALTTRIVAIISIPQNKTEHKKQNGNGVSRRG